MGDKWSSKSPRTQLPFSQKDTFLSSWPLVVKLRKADRSNASICKDCLVKRQVDPNVDRDVNKYTRCTSRIASATSTTYNPGSNSIPGFSTR